MRSATRCTSVMACLCVCVCVIMKKKEPDERQARHATRTKSKKETIKRPVSSVDHCHPYKKKKRSKNKNPNNFQPSCFGTCIETGGGSKDDSGSQGHYVQEERKEFSDTLTNATIASAKSCKLSNQTATPSARKCHPYMVIHREPCTPTVKSSNRVSKPTTSSWQMPRKIHTEFHHA